MMTTPLIEKWVGLLPVWRVSHFQIFPDMTWYLNRDAFKFNLSERFVKSPGSGVHLEVVTRMRRKVYITIFYWSPQIHVTKQLVCFAEVDSWIRRSPFSAI